MNFKHLRRGRQKESVPAEFFHIWNGRHVNRIAGFSGVFGANGRRGQIRNAILGFRVHRIHQCFEVLARYWLGDYVPNSQSGRGVAHRLLAYAGNDTDSIGGNEARKMAELRRRIERIAFPKYKVGAQTIAQEGLSLLLFASLDYTMACTLKDHSGEGSDSRILNYRQNQEQRSHKASF